MFENQYVGGYQSPAVYYRPQQYTPQPMQRMPAYGAMELVSVNGRAGADAFRMDMPNSRVALFDANDDVFYIKATDGAGYPTVQAFRFTPISETAEKGSADFITRSEYNEFKQEIMEGIKNVQQFIYGVKNEPTGSAAEQ